VDYYRTTMRAAVSFPWRSPLKPGLKTPILTVYSPGTAFAGTFQRARKTRARPGLKVWWSK